jgi:hypothetical protein
LKANNGDWFVKSGAELLTDSTSKGVGLITIRLNELTLVKLTTEEWQSLTPAQLSEALKRDSSGLKEDEMNFGKVYVLSTNTPPPVTLGFRTSAGTEGILQARWSDGVKQPPVTLRYKLVQGAKESIPAFGSGDSVLIWHWDMAPEPLTVYVMEDRIYHDPAPLLARLAGLSRQQPFAAVPVRLGPAAWAETEGPKVVRELENALRDSCPARLAVGEMLSELPLEIDDGLYSVTVPAWDINKDSALDLDHGTLNQTNPPLSLDFSKPETLEAWRRMGFDAYVPPGSNTLVLPTLPAALVPAPDEWEQSEIGPRALMQKIASLAGRDRDQQDSAERPVTALFAAPPQPGWLLTDHGSLLLVKVGKDEDDPDALKVSWRRVRQAILHGETRR